jgi:hypothetical protein
MNADEASYQAARTVAHAESAEVAAARLLRAVEGSAPGLRDRCAMLAIAAAELADRSRRVRAALNEVLYPDAHAG